MPEQYAIRRGDSLSKIARQYGMTWRELYNYQANSGRLRSNDPSLIFPGEVILVRDEHDVNQDAPPDSQPAPPPSTSASPLRPPTTGGGAVGDPALPCPACTSATEVGAGTHWIVIELVDTELDPVARDRYRVVLPNGSVVEGRLDADGRARLVGIDEEGHCLVSFPDRDANDWRRSATLQGAASEVS